MMRPQEEWIEVEVPAIIDESLWLHAQERLELNQKFATRNNKKHFYLLRSLLVCDCCGHTLQGRSQNGRISYFCQYGSKKRYEDVPKHRNTIRGDIIEPLVWDAIAELLKHPNQIFAAWESQSEDDAKPNQLTRLQKRLNKVERQWERLLDAFQDGLIEKSDLSSRKTRLDQERQILTEQIAHFQRHEMKQQVKEQVLQDFIAYCDTIQVALDNPTPQLGMSLTSVKQSVTRLMGDELHIRQVTSNILLEVKIKEKRDESKLDGRRTGSRIHATSR